MWAYNGNGIATGYTAHKSTKTLDENATLTVVINEVAHGGTAASSADEWIELHNNTGALIDLTGWKLYENITTNQI